MSAKFSIVDEGGKFERFTREFPQVLERLVKAAQSETGRNVKRRIEQLAPFGPDAPHIRDAVSVDVQGTSIVVGYLNATEPSAPGSNYSIADVAMFNEYQPNNQPFMRPAAEAEVSAFKRRIEDAIKDVERQLSA